MLHLLTYPRNDSMGQSPIRICVRSQSENRPQTNGRVSSTQYSCRLSKGSLRRALTHVDTKRRYIWMKGRDHGCIRSAIPDIRRTFSGLVAHNMRIVKPSACGSHAGLSDRITFTCAWMTVSSSVPYGEGSFSARILSR